MIQASDFKNNPLQKNFWPEEISMFLITNKIAIRNKETINTKKVGILFLSDTKTYEPSHFSTLTKFLNE